MKNISSGAIASHASLMGLKEHFGEFERDVKNFLFAAAELSPACVYACSYHKILQQVMVFTSANVRLPIRYGLTRFTKKLIENRHSTINKLMRPLSFTFSLAHIPLVRSCW